MEVNVQVGEEQQALSQCHLVIAELAALSDQSPPITLCLSTGTPYRSAAPRRAPLGLRRGVNSAEPPELVLHRSDKCLTQNTKTPPAAIVIDELPTKIRLKQDRPVGLHYSKTLSPT